MDKAPPASRKQKLPGRRASDATVCAMHLPGQVLSRWKRLRKTEGLRSDGEIANFLIQLYESTQHGADVRCVHCHGLLTLFCTKCQLPNASQNTKTKISKKSKANLSSNSVTRKKTYSETFSKDRMVVSSRDVLEYLSDEESLPPAFEPRNEEGQELFRESRGVQGKIGLVENSSENQKHHAGSVSLDPLVHATTGSVHKGVKIDNQVLHSKFLNILTESDNDQNLALHVKDSDTFMSVAAGFVGRRGAIENSQTGDVSIKDEPSVIFEDQTQARSAVTLGQLEVSGQAPDLEERDVMKVNLVHATTGTSNSTGDCTHIGVKCDVHSTDSVDSNNYGSLPQATSYSCKELGCSDSFSTSAELRKHIKSHKAAAPYRCPECRKRFSVRDLLNEHLKTHYRCEVCDIGFAYKPSVQRHMKSKHDEAGASISQCPHCGLTFTHKNGFHHHIKTYHAKEHKCEECEKVFPDYLTLKGHLEEHYKCEECNVSFYSKSSMKCHLTTRHGQAQVVSVCHVCGTSTNNLREHMRRHSGSKPFKCDTCEKTFCTRTALTRHRIIHTGARPYQCHLCSATYKDPSGLRGHLIIHGGRKPHKCSTCPKSFSTAMQLKIHVRNHTGEKPYECPACHKKFRTSSEKEFHIRRRYKTGETPCLGPVYEPRVYSERHRFECPVCERKFTTSSHLKQHRNRRNKMGEMPCYQNPA